jgi:hypothetical protein
MSCCSLLWLAATAVRAQTMTPELALEGLEKTISEAGAFHVDSRAQEWSREAAELVQAQPSLVIEEALADSFVRSHPAVRVSPEKIKTILRRTLHHSVLIPKPLPREAVRVESTGGNLYALGPGGVHVLENGNWTHMPYDSPGQSIAASPDGTVWAALTSVGFLSQWRSGLWRREDPLRCVRGMRCVGDTVWAATDDGVLYKTPGQNWRDAGFVSSIWDVFDVDGKPWLRTHRDKLLHQENGRGWIEASPDIGRIETIRSVRGVPYASSPEGLYDIRDPQFPARLLSGPAHDAADADGSVLAATGDGLIRLGKTPEPAGLEGRPVTQVVEHRGRIFVMAGHPTELYERRPLAKGRLPEDWQGYLANWLRLGQTFHNFSAEGENISRSSRTIFSSGKDKP